MVNLKELGSFEEACRKIGGKLSDNDCIINSKSLPYFKDNIVSFFTIESKPFVEGGKSFPVEVDADKFVDVTTDGGRFHQFFTFKIKK